MKRQTLQKVFFNESNEVFESVVRIIFLKYFLFKKYQNNIFNINISKNIKKILI